MRHLLILVVLTLFSDCLEAQIRGNRDIQTRQVSTADIEELDISLYAKIEVDLSQESSMTITTDANLFEFIDYEVIDGRLELTQKEWISASQDIIIKIGAPNLRWVQQGTHDLVVVKNIDREEFSASALVGDIHLQGQVSTLNANGEVGDIDATELLAAEVNVNLWKWGKVKLNAPERITGTVKGDGRIIYESDNTTVDVKKNDGGRVINKMDSNKSITLVNPEARFINLKIKNNSFKRINAYVRGPKPDGSYFSYGFPMRPGQVRKKDWSVGSKVYKVSGMGFKKLLVEISENDEGEVVMLYPK